ncbi:metalloprotease family protein [Halorussus salilacus]|uniref:metalloprotease family protein n=1 Tax=Halorussus salilacus TaxID=2953750 RepID=UPI0020A00FE0|nr:metalloprotease family protein [Halorussus salilacus]USZ69310.1 metalloprotease family protein [Halorussus salilacus]
MLIIPGFLISLVTFPGVVVHEFAHERLCARYDVPVAEVCYFRLGNPAGYVLHEEPDRYRDAFAVSVAPFLVNTLIALALFGVLALLWGKPDASGFHVDRFGIAGYALLWLGASVAMHAFPSTGDAKNIWARTKSEWREHPVVLLALPAVLVIYLANLLSIFWLDAIYALGLLLVALLSVGMLH